MIHYNVNDVHWGAPALLPGLTDHQMTALRDNPELYNWYWNMIRDDWRKWASYFAPQAYKELIEAKP